MADMNREIFRDPEAETIEEVANDHFGVGTSFGAWCLVAKRMVPAKEAPVGTR